MSKLKANKTPPPAYVNAQRRRQRVLNFLNENPAQALPVITAHMKEQGDNASMDNTMRTLLLFGEVAYTGGHGRRKYSAMAVKTRSAQQVMEERESKITAKYFDEEAKTVTLKKSKNGHYIHRPGVYENVPGHIQGQPIRNQEAQGSGRQRVWVGSAMA